MQPPPVNQKIKTALELGPVLAFFVGYIMLRERVFEIGGTEYAGFIVLTGVFIPVFMLASWLMYRLVGRVSRIQIVTLVMVVVFGGLTVWLNDERFFKMKSTIVFGLISGLLWIGLARGQSWLEYVMEGVIRLQHEGWMVLTRRLAWFFAGLAVANEIIWRSLSTDIWVTFDTFGQPAAVFVFFMAQTRLIEAHMIEDGDGSS
ncbi:MAG: inner membrane-spanning protein YciB [Alkalilacustris sp.]